MKNVLPLIALLCNLSAIDDLQTRHVMAQFLACMWCIIFSMSVGSMTVFGITAVAHALLLAGVVVTIATFKAAQYRPTVLFSLQDGFALIIYKQNSQENLGSGGGT